MSGLLIFAPCGTGKSHFIDKYGEIFGIVDGDVLLKKKNIRNRNYFWYMDYDKEIQTIMNAIKEVLNEGFHVMYSGNPLKYKPDIIVTISAEERWRRVSTRKGYNPTIEQFNREEEAYSKSDVQKLSVEELLSNFLQ